MFQKTGERYPLCLKHNLINAQRGKLTSEPLLLAISVPLMILEHCDLLLLYLLLHGADDLGVLHVGVAHERLVLASQ